MFILDFRVSINSSTPAMLSVTGNTISEGGRLATCFVLTLPLVLMTGAVVKSIASLDRKLHASPHLIENKVTGVLGRKSLSFFDPITWWYVPGRIPSTSSCLYSVSQVLSSRISDSFSCRASWCRSLFSLSVSYSHPTSWRRIAFHRPRLQARLYFPKVRFEAVFDYPMFSTPLGRWRRTADYTSRMCEYYFLVKKLRVYFLR